MLEVRTNYLELVAGRIDEVGGECIATHFLAPFGLPLFPQRSLYLKSELRDARRQMSHFGQSIPLVWKSVVLGYLRIWLGWAWIASPWVLMWGESLDFNRPEWFVTLGLFVAWLLVVFVPGRLSKSEKARRAALHGATGVHLPPKYLGRFELEDTTEELRGRLEEAGVEATPEAVERASESADEALARQLFAYASYAAVFHGESTWRAVADRGWARLSGG